MAETNQPPYVGRPLKRVEDPKLVTGQGLYVEDIKLPGLAHLAFLRSPHANARIKSIRTGAAAEAPGVIRVVTARDLGPLKSIHHLILFPGMKPPPYQYIADEVVDATGVPVAAVVAELLASGHQPKRSGRNASGSAQSSGS